MPAATTLITPAENRFFILSERARRATSLNQISRLLREHVTIKADSDFLLDTVRNLIMHDHADWLTTCSHEWQLLATLPYVINPSDSRQQWSHCELCHKPVRYEYHVQNKHNHQEIVVGSECVKKFMNAETRYLMVITTEDNFYAVAQYQTLTAKVPTVPTIMFKQPWFPELPGAQQPQARQVRQQTSQTVTTYLKRKTKQLPLHELQPSLTTYQALVQAEADAIAAKQAAKIEQQTAVQHHRQQTAQQAVQSAANELRTSPAYRQYLRRLADIIVTRPDRAAAKSAFSALKAPQTSRPLVNAYQFGLMVTEYTQTGQIQVRRLAMLNRAFVADLNQVTKALDQRQTTRFYDDIFNSCWGWDYHQAATQRADWERLLATRWGRELSLAWFEQLAQQTTPTAITAWLQQNATATMQQKLARRLKAQPALKPVPRQRLTKRELRTFCDREVAASADAAALTARFETMYQLPAAQQAVMLETLNYYYVAQHSATDHQAALKQLQWLLK